MGCSSSKGGGLAKTESTKKRASVNYRQDLGDDFLEAIKTKLPAQTKVFVIKLMRIANISIDTDRLGTYVELSMPPSEFITAKQWQVCPDIKFYYFTFRFWVLYCAEEYK